MKILKDVIVSLSEFEDQRDGLGLKDCPSAPTHAHENTTNEAVVEHGVQVDTLVGHGCR